MKVITSAKSAKRPIFQQLASANLWSKFLLKPGSSPLGQNSELTKTKNARMTGRYK